MKKTCTNVAQEYEEKMKRPGKTNGMPYVARDLERSKIVQKLHVYGAKVT